MTKQEFINKYYPEAVEAAKGSHIFPLTIMGAAATESGWGESGLTKEAFNFFGIKSTPSWEQNGGKFVTKRTREVVVDKDVYIDAKFRLYATPADCFRNYVSFVSGKRYEAAGVLNALNPHDQIDKIAKAGYATDPQYAKTISAVITVLEKLIK